MRQASRSAVSHPPVSDIRDLISYRIARFAAANDRLGQLLIAGEFGIRLNQWRVLALVHCCEPVSFRVISSELGMDKGQLSRIGKQLKNDGLIESSVPSFDQRTITWRTTPKGKELYKSVFSFTLRRNRDFMAKLTSEEVNSLFSTLDKLSDIVNESLLKLDQKDDD